MRTTKSGKINAFRGLPRWCRWILRKAFDDGKESCVGDFEEVYASIRIRKKRIYADFWLFTQACITLFDGFRGRFIWRMIMVRSYCKMAFRQIRRQKLYSFINVLGLALGLASFFLIMAWVRDELFYDRFHDHADRLYRVNTEQVNAAGTMQSAETQYPLARVLREEFPEIVESARVFTKWENTYIRNGRQSFIKDRLLFVDPSFLTMFSFMLERGDRERALADPHSVVLTDETAKRYFGDADPLGRVIQLDYGRKLTDFKVTGILSSYPQRSHLQFDILISFRIFDVLYQDTADLWKTADNYHTYILLEKQASAIELAPKLENVKARYIPGCLDKLRLQPVTSIHLHSNVKFDTPGNGDIRYVRFMKAIAVIILLIACVNYMNLSSARSTHRMKEVGLRKVAGATRNLIMRQFFGEALSMAFLGLIIGLVLIGLFIPQFNHLSGKHLHIGSHRIGPLVCMALLVTLMTGMVSGSYPALVLSSFPPSRVFRDASSANGGRGGRPFRRILVILQFVFSITLFIGTWIVSNQLRFMLNKPLGYEKEGLLFIPVRGDVHRQYPAMKEALLANPYVVDVSAANILPTHLNESPLSDWEGNEAGDQITVSITSVDYDYFQTMRMMLKSGRSFSRLYRTDLTESVIVNEEAVRQMGMTHAVGKRLWGRRIIGVVQDYHFTSVEDPIEPIVLTLTDRNFANIFIRIRSDYAKAIAGIQQIYEITVTEYPFEFHFLDADLERFYAADVRVKRLFSYFTVLALILACMGLFGLASYTVETRNKEIGIRKVLGASFRGILKMLSWEFFLWAAIANIIAWPVSYAVMKHWLNHFAYRIGISPWIFMSAAMLSFGVTVLTVGYHAIRSAMSNPVDVLRGE